jgi:hypothetical protein
MSKNPRRETAMAVLLATYDVPANLKLVVGFYT